VQKEGTCHPQLRLEDYKNQHHKSINVEGYRRKEKASSSLNIVIQYSLKRRMIVQPTHMSQCLEGIIHIKFRSVVVLTLV